MANVYISFEGPESGAFRVPKGATGGNRPGTYTSTSPRLRTLYGRLAKELQDEVAKTILSERSVREKNPRKKNPKGTLAKVTRDHRNANVTNAGFQVGSHVFLARSAAKYARIIEEGSAAVAPRYFETLISGSWRGEEPTGYIIPQRADRRRADLTRRNIRPLLAYSRAWHNINANGRLNKIWRDILVEEGLVSPRGGPLPKQFRLGNIDY